MYLTLNSRDAVPSSHSPGVVRFLLDCPLRHVSKVEWLTMETHNGRTTTMDLPPSRLCFSEDLRFFEAVVPRGSYTVETLKGAVEAAMACSVAKQDGQGPRNVYYVSILNDSKRVCISGKGPAPFSLHIFSERVAVQSLRRIVGGDWQLRYFCNESSPMVRGSIVEIFRSGRALTTAQVVHSSGSGRMVVVRRLEGPELMEGLEGWSMRPLYCNAMLPDLLGLGNVDLSSSSPIDIVGCSDLSHFCVGTSGPHGLNEGDVVEVDGMEGLSTTKAIVKNVVSEQQVVLDVCWDDVLRKACKLMIMCQGKVVEVFMNPNWVTCEEGRVVADVSLCHNQVLPKCLLADQWTDVRMLPPFPSKEWGVGKVSAKRGQESGKLSLGLRLPRPRITASSCLSRSAVVGAKSMMRDTGVRLVRLWLGLTEAYGVSTTRSRYFGRAQLRGDGYLTSSDHSVIGEADFYPSLERVAFLEMGFVTAQGDSIPTNLMGEFSMLLRITALA